MLSYDVALKLVALAAMTLSTYAVHHGRVTVDGALDDAAWRDAALERSFSFPWQEREAPSTAFRALADDSRLYFAFRVEDADVVVDPGDDERAVARGDRVELFFTPDDLLEDYICLEIDPRGRVLDYRASYYRKFDRAWDLPELDVAAALTGDGYVVEGAIPLEALPVSPSGELLTGVFRAEYSHRPGGEPLAEWISWVQPDSDEPDFHIPSAFGVFQTR